MELGYSMLTIVAWFIVFYANRKLFSQLRERKQPSQWALQLGKHDAKAVSLLRMSTALLLAAIAIASLSALIASADLDSALASANRCGDSVSCLVEARYDISSSEVRLGRVESLLIILAVL